MRDRMPFIVYHPIWYHLCCSPAETMLPKPSHEKTSDKPTVRRHILLYKKNKKGIVFFKNARVIEEKEKFQKYSRLRNTKGAWQPHTLHESRPDPIVEKWKVRWRILLAQMKSWGREDKLDLS